MTETYANAHAGRLGKLEPHKELLPAEINLSKHLSDNVKNPLQFSRPGVDALAYGEMLNDQIGDCTCAGVAHAIQVLTYVSSGVAVTLSDEQVLALYELLSGYNPTTGQNDNGCIESDVLEHWRTDGVNGHKIAAHGKIEPWNTDHIKTAIRLFGFVYIGLQMPQAWCLGPDVWDFVSGDGAQIEGGHCVILTGWDSTHFTLVSWGRTYRISHRALARYCDEVHAVISFDWLNAAGTDVDGLNLASLEADMNTFATPEQPAQVQTAPAKPSVTLAEILKFEDAIKALNWKRLANAGLGGLGAVALALIGVWLKDSGASAADFIEAAVPAFVVGTGLSHWAPNGTVEAEALAKLEADLITALEKAVASVEANVQPTPVEPEPSPAPAVEQPAGPASPTV